jgi:Glycosyl transferase 4-like
MRVLFVAMLSSVHVARWINQVSDKGWDIHLFSSTTEPIHPNLRNVTVYGVSTF